MPDNDSEIARQKMVADRNKKALVEMFRNNPSGRAIPRDTNGTHQEEKNQ